MHPKLEDMRWFGVAVGLTVGITLLTVYGLTCITIIVMGISFILIISPYGLIKSSWFQQIKIKASMYLDTYSLRFYLADKERAKSLPMPELRLICDIEFYLVYGEAGIKNQIGIKLPHDMQIELASLVNWAKLAFQDYLLTKTGQERIELKRGLQSFHIEEILYLQATPNPDINSKLERISEKLERGYFDIRWETVMDGKPKLYKAKRQDDGL